jgi:hypothetical protein
MSTSVGCRGPVSVEAIGDLSETQTRGTGFADPLDDLGGHGGRSTCSLWAAARACRASPVGEDSLELVGGDQFRAPRSLDRFDVGEYALGEGRAADAERLRCLGARVGESLDPVRLADDDLGLLDRGCWTEPRSRRVERVRGRCWWRRRLLMALRSSVPTPETAARHAYTVHKLDDGSAPWCICVSL